MKKTIYTLLTISILIGCQRNNKTKNEELSFFKRIEKSEDQAGNIETPNQQSTTESEEDDCIFDQKTQTDSFLKNIKELDTYVWDQESNTATIVLEYGDSLFITRGGCNHFGVTSKFHFNIDATDYSDWNKVFEKVLWIGELLEKEYYFEEVKSEIENETFSIQEHEPNVQAIWFENQLLIDNNYEIIRRFETDKTVIEFSYNVY